MQFVCSTESQQKAPEGRRNILSIFWGFTGAMSLLDNWHSPSYSVAPPGLLWVGHLYRGDAPACIPLPLRGFCVQHNHPRSTLGFPLVTLPSPFACKQELIQPMVEKTLKASEVFKQRHQFSTVAG